MVGSGGKPDGLGVRRRCCHGCCHWPWTFGQVTDLSVMLRPWPRVFDLPIPRVCNGHVEPHQTDLISAAPRPVSRQRAWAAAAVILAIALAAAITIAIHYHAEAAAGRHHVRRVFVTSSPRPGPLTLSIRTAVLPSAGTLTGEITVFAARSAPGSARIILSGRITGGVPHKRYVLVGNDCTSSAPDHPWAAGVADARGQASLSGPAWTVSTQDEYWLWLTPWPHRQTPGLHGSLTAGGRLTAFRAGWAPCSPA